MICKICKCDNITSTIFDITISEEYIITHVKNVCPDCGKIIYTDIEYSLSKEYEVNPPYLEIPQ